MDIVNHEILLSSNMLGTMFFACTIYITLVIARYATLAKLIRDSRSNVETNKLRFKSQSEYSFHILHYEKRLKLLRYTLYLSLFGGIALCTSLLFLLLNYSFISAISFGIHLCLVLLALVTLVYELAVSFEALTEHLDIMRTLKDKF
jgi:magnesium-transporting ATPase (P-type)